MPHGLTGERHRSQHLFRVRSEGPAGRGEAEAATPALEEGHGQGALEGLDAGAHGRLRQVQCRGGPAEPAEGAHGQESLDLSNLHGRSPGPSAPLIRISYLPDKHNPFA